MCSNYLITLCQQSASLDGRLGDCIEREQVLSLHSLAKILLALLMLYKMILLCCG